jgi:hypothetical protein
MTIKIKYIQEYHQVINSLTFKNHPNQLKDKNTSMIYRKYAINVKNQNVQSFVQEYVDVHSIENVMKKLLMERINKKR